MKNINEILIKECQNNFKYYKNKYGKKYPNILNNSLIDTNNMIGGITRCVMKEDKYLLGKIFTECKADYRGITEVLVMKYAEYFPSETIETCKYRLVQWEINYEEYLK